MRAAGFVPAAVVLLALGALGAVAQLDHPAAAAAPVTATRPVTVSSAERACPPALSGGSGAVASIAAPTQASGSAVSGQAQLTALPQAGLALRPVSPVNVTSAGALSLLTVPAASSTAKKSTQTPAGWSVSASGTMAQAIEAEVAQPSGLGSVRCAEPGSDIWFAGPGQQNGASQIQLDLMNIDSLAANVDIRMITDAGPIQLGNGTGITVPPHTTVTQSLASSAGSSDVVAIEVHTTEGRVAADVSEGGSHGSTTNWVPSAAEPATRLVIPGIPQSSGAAGLYLVVPGNANAKVNVVAISTQGQFRPFSSQAVELPSESASYVALTPLGGAAAALEITSNVPVTAAVLVPGSGVGAFTVATAPISEQAVVAGNTDSSGLSASVVLSAPAGAARVRLTEIAEATGSGAASPATAATATRASQVSSVPAGRTVVVPVKAPPGAKSGSPFAVVITPMSGSGPLYAARVETKGQTVVSIIPAVSALTTISLPPVRDSYDAISP